MGIKTQIATRKIHRYLGLFIGIQFLFWTIGGLYFSWNNMDDVHGETLLDKTEHSFYFQYNEPLRKLMTQFQEPSAPAIKRMEGIVVGKDSLVRVTLEEETVFLKLNPQEYSTRKELTQEESVAFVKSRLYNPLEVASVEYLTEVAKDHEYRGNPLPAYAITLDHETNTTVYVHPKTARITKVRNDNWRRFDFLWMMHVMDFETRDHITNWTLRIFSILGLLTILSGLYLFFISSPSIRKLKKKLKG